MPLADVSIPHDNFRKLRAFATPKNIQSEEAWIRAIRISIPEVPDLRNTDWEIINFDVDTVNLKWISIVLVDTLGRRIKIVVDRKGGTF